MTEQEYANPFEAFGVDADSVDADPFSIKEVNSYPFVISSAEVKTFKDIQYFVVEFSITEGKMAGRGASVMSRITPFSPGEEDFEVKKARALSNYKKSLLDIGLNEGQIKAFNVRIHADKLIGIRGTATFGPQKNNPQYNSVSNIKVAGTATEGTVAASPTTTASVTPTEPLSAENAASVLGNW
jgi:hypothetical protein